MDIGDLVDLLNGEFVGNKAQARVDGEMIVIGFVGKTEWELTSKGQELANAVVADVETPPAKLTRSGKPDARYK